MSAKIKTFQQPPADKSETGLDISQLPKRYQDLLAALRDRFAKDGERVRSESTLLAYISSDELGALRCCVGAMDDITRTCVQDGGPGGAAGLVYRTLSDIYDQIAKRMEDSTKGGAA